MLIALSSGHFMLQSNHRKYLSPSGRIISAITGRMLRHMHLASGAYLAKKQNILITGATGVGKSFLAQALARAAIFQGYSARYYRVTRLLEEIKLARHAGSYTKTLEQLSKFALLILDDFGVSPLGSDEVKDLFEVIEERTLSGSTIITAQLPVKEWYPKGISSLRSGHMPISTTTPSPMP